MSVPSSDSEAVDRRRAIWKTRGVAVPVRLLDRQEEQTEAVVYTGELSNGQRAARAAKTLMACWALAVGSVLIPMAHFVLVPGFLIAGPLLAANRYGQRATVLGGAGQCPTCDNEVLVAAQALSWPLWARCETCHKDLEVQQR
jgi:hypothetical protein